jgi:hypothetical protein
MGLVVAALSHGKGRDRLDEQVEKRANLLMVSPQSLNRSSGRSGEKEFSRHGLFDPHRPEP